MKAPALLIEIIIVQVRVVGHQLVVGLPAELFGQNAHQRAFADTDISGDGDVLATGRACVLHRAILLLRIWHGSPDYTLFTKHGWRPLSIIVISPAPWHAKIKAGRVDTYTRGCLTRKVNVGM